MQKYEDFKNIYTPLSEEEWQSKNQEMQQLLKEENERYLRKWIKNGIVVKEKKAQEALRRIENNSTQEICVEIYTSIGVRPVYFCSQDHVMAPGWADFYALSHRSFPEYAKTLPEYNNYEPGSFEVVLKRDIDNVLSLLGFDSSTFKHGKHFVLTESVEKLFTYLKSLKQRQSFDKRSFQINQIELCDANQIYSLIVKAFDSIPPVRDYKSPFDEKRNLNIDPQKRRDRYRKLDVFCSKTHASRFNTTSVIYTFIAEIINTEMDERARKKWDRFNSDGQTYIKALLYKKCERFQKSLTHVAETEIYVLYDEYCEDEKHGIQRFKK